MRAPPVRLPVCPGKLVLPQGEVPISNVRLHWPLRRISPCPSCISQCSVALPTLLLRWGATGEGTEQGQRWDIPWAAPG